jgi:hypothetical protein
MRQVQHIVTVALLALAGVVGACGGKQDVSNEQVELPPRARHGNLTGSRPATADVNLDGRPDQFVHTVDGRVVRTERDLDFDGQIDLYEYYDASGAVVEQEFQLDFDPAIDAVRYYQAGALVRKELSTGYSGLFTIVKRYDVDGTLLTVERDSDLDGAADVWEYYEGGRLMQIGRDLDGDGSPEVIEDAT